MDSKNRMTDDALVKAYIGGDAEAFDCLLARHQDRLFQHIFYAVHDEDLANDIFQETCLLYTSPSPRDRSLSRMPSSA